MKILNEANFWTNSQNYMNTKGATAVCFSHIGKRLNHEDNFFLDGSYLPSDIQKQMGKHHYYFASSTASSRVQLFAVSDGMGGHNAGEIASRICVEKLAVAYKELQKSNSMKEAVAYLQTTIAQINNTVCDMSRKHPELKGMGATLILFVVCEKECAVLNVGDSRAYSFYNNTMVQITKDHTEGQRILDLGLLTKKELSSFPARKNLNRYVGYEKSGYVLQADEYYPILENGVMLLCSDGISDFLSDAKIAEILSVESTLEAIGMQLINNATASLNADNATVMLISLRR